MTGAAPSSSTTSSVLDPIDLSALPEPLRVRAENAIAELAEVTTAWKQWSSTEDTTRVREGAGNVVGVRASRSTPPALFDAFRNASPEAAMILARSSDAMKLFDAADEAGVAFGGSGSDTFTNYGDGVSIHVEASSDALLTVRNVLVELSNSLQAARVFAALAPEALASSNSEQFAQTMAEVEMNSALDTAHIWQGIKTQFPERVTRRYRDDFYETYLEDDRRGVSRQTLVDGLLEAVQPNGFTKREIFQMGFRAQLEAAAS